MSRRFEKLLSILLTSWMFFSTSTLCHAAIALVQEPHSNLMPRFVFDASYVRHDNSQITGGIISNTFTQANTTGLQRKQNFHSYALGVGVWWPLYQYKQFDLYVLSQLNHIPGASSVVEYTNSGQGAREVAQINANRTNTSIGANLIWHFDPVWHAMMSVAGGVSWYHAHAEFINYGTTLNGNGADHPGISSAQPFGHLTVGIGRHITQATWFHGFLEWAAVREDTPLRLTSRGGSVSLTNGAAGRVDIKQAKNWYRLGVALSHNINI